MNRISSGSIRLEKAIQGLIQAKEAEGCSDRTTVTYAQHLKVWLDYKGDVEINSISTQDVRAFLAWLRR